MQSAAQRDGSRSGAGASGQGERSQPFRADLVHWKCQAHYWRSQHARAKERIATLQAQWKATKQELAEALQKMQGLRQQVQVLQQENEGLRQENKQLLQSPFKKRSEKSRSKGRAGSDGGPESEPGAGQGAARKRRRGGQPGAAAHGRADRSGLEVREEVHEPEAGRRQCADCGRPYSRNVTARRSARGSRSKLRGT